jgi:hypothetical protein
MTLNKKEFKINGLPISFAEFVKEPVKGLMFICLIAVGYLYVDGKINYENQIEAQGKKIEALEVKIDVISSNLHRSDSLLAASLSKLTTLQELGKIK